RNSRKIRGRICWAAKPALGDTVRGREGHRAVRRRPGGGGRPCAERDFEEAALCPHADGGLRYALPGSWELVRLRLQFHLLHPHRPCRLLQRRERLIERECVAADESPGAVARYGGHHRRRAWFALSTECPHLAVGGARPDGDVKMPSHEQH